MDKNKVVSILNKVIEWALYSIIFCLPFSKTIIEIAIIVATIAWVTKKVLLKDFTLKKTPLNISLFAFFLACCISMVNADNKAFVAYALITKSLKWIILYFIIVEELNSETKLKNLCTMAILSTIIIVADGLIQYYFTHWDLIRGNLAFKYRTDIIQYPIYRGFPTGPFGFPNDLSSWIVVMLLPALSVAMFSRLRIYTRFGLGFLSASLLYLFYLANTRGAWLGFMISFFLILLLKKSKLLIVVILLILFTIPFLSVEKRRDIYDMSSMADRQAMWGTGWKIFMEHPVIGNGLNTFFGKFKEFREDKAKGKLGSYAHNGFLQIAADTGIVGLMVFLAILAQAFYTAARRLSTENKLYQSLTIGLAGGLLTFLIHAFFDTNLQSLPLVALFWFNLALLMCLPNIYARKT